MTTFWSGRRFTLLDTGLCTRIKTMARSSHVGTRTYLGELVQMACHENGTSLADCPMIVDPLVAAWLAVHRSGLPCQLTPIESPSNDCYFLPRGIRFLNEYTVEV